MLWWLGLARPPVCVSKDNYRGVLFLVKRTAHWAAGMEKYMTLTIVEFRKLMSLYQNDSLTEENLIFQNAVVPIDAVIQAVSIAEDSSIDSDEKYYLIKGIYEEVRFGEFDDE